MFDPSKPFEKVEESIGFDPSQPFERVEEKPEEEKPGMLASAAQGAIQGISLGFADELEAGLRSRFSEDSYEDTLQKVRARYKEAQETNPWSYGVGAVGASLLPGGLIAKGVGSAVKAGAAIGGIEAIGTTEEEKLSKEALKDMATGAAIGGVLGKGGELLGTGIEKIAPKIAKPFEKADLLHKTPTTQKKELLNPVLAEKTEQAVKKGEELGLWGVTFKGTLDNVQDKLKEVGSELGNTSKDLPELFKNNLQLTDDVLNVIDAGKLKLHGETLKKASTQGLNKKQAKKATEIVDESFSTLIEHIDESRNALESLRQARIGLTKRLKDIDFQQPSDEATLMRGTTKRLVDSFRELENEAINAYKQHIQDPGMLKRLDAYRDNMDTYSKLKTLEDKLATTAAKSGEKLFSIKDLLIGLVGGTIDVGAGAGGMVTAAAGRHVMSPAGKLAVKRIAEKMGISESNAKKLIESGRIPASFLTTEEVIGDKE